MWMQIIYIIWCGNCFKALFLEKLLKHCYLLCWGITLWWLCADGSNLLLFQRYLLWSCCYLWRYRCNYSTNKVRECSKITDLCTRVSQSRICYLCIWDYCGLCKPFLRVRILFFTSSNEFSLLIFRTFFSLSLTFLVILLLATGCAWESLEAVVHCLMLKTPLFLWRFLWLKSLVVPLVCSEWSWE